MNSYTDVGIAHAELPLITSLSKERTLWGRKTSFGQYILGEVTCNLEYLKTRPMFV
jgi:hypothetical protein